MIVPQRPTTCLNGWGFKLHDILSTSGEEKLSSTQWFSYSCLHNKTLDTKAQAGKAHPWAKRVMPLAPWETARKPCVWDPPRPRPRVSSVDWPWFLSFCSNKTVIISMVLSWVLWITLANYWIWRGSGNPKSVAILSGIKLTWRPWTCLKWEQFHRGLSP